MMGFWTDSGISWTICKQYAPRSRQITTPTPHQSIFTGQVLFLCPTNSDKALKATTATRIQNTKTETGDQSVHIYMYLIIRN